MKPDEAMDLLREAHREPIPEAHFAAVRARVLSQIVAERGVSRRRIWWYGFAVVAAAILLLFWPKQPISKNVVLEGRSPLVKPLANVPELVSSHQHETVAITVRSRTHRRLPVTGVIGPPNPTPLVVKMLTDDPKVVIYWISTGTGE